MNFLFYFKMIVKISNSYYNVIMVLIWIIIGLLLIGMLIAGTAYSRTVRIIDKYSNLPSKLGCKAIDFAQVCSNSFDLNLKFALTDKKLENAYVTNKNVIILDKNIAYSNSVSAISIVAHEVGHAIQDKNGKFLLKLDLFMKSVFKVLKFLAIPIIIAGIVMLFFESYFLYGEILLLVAVGIWIFSLLTRIITIPMEYEASKIAYDILKDNRLLTRAELKITKKILRAAALTYVGALFVNLLNFFRAIKRSFRV